MADLNPQQGTEAGRVRPVLVVQTDLLNGHHPSTLVCPVTTNVVKSATRLRVHMPAGRAGLKRESDIMIDQVRAIDNRRIIQTLGAAPEGTMQRVSESLAMVLDLIISSSS